MKIQDSNINMASERSYRQGSTNQSVSGARVGTGLSWMNNTSWKNLMDSLEISDDLDSRYLGSSNYGKNALGINEDLIFPSPEEMHTMRMGIVEQTMQRIRSNFSSGGAFSTSTYYEEETTSFSAMGQVNTADGRTIDFNIEVTMTRSFMQQTRMSMPSLFGAFMDPLILNTNAPITKMNDQKFLFDLDGDGKDEYIPMPSKGCGFLSLDKNGDGKINDGNELFGARTGDGFGELREYDSDGNGWIDENDEIFDKLRVWYKDENGNDVLMDLKEADIGAIFLGEQATDFSLMGTDFNENAQIRSTGFFLRESGGAGTIQHVDLRAEDPLEHLMNVMNEYANQFFGDNTSKSMSTEVKSKGLAFSTGESPESIAGIRSEKTEVSKESDSKDTEAMNRIDKMAQERRLHQARLKKRAEERRQERKEILEAELEKLRQHRSEEEARLEALFGERERIAQA